MSKITTQDCKQFLVEQYEDSNISDWSRTRKYKDDNGQWIREFLNKETEETVSLKEQNGQLSLVNFDEVYDFVFYRQKNSAPDRQWGVLIGIDEEEEEDDGERLNELVSSLFSQNELSWFEGPNYGCEAQDALKVHETLIKAGWRVNTSLVDTSYFETFDPAKPALLPLKGKKINISVYTLIEALGIEAKKGPLPQDYFNKVVFVIQNLELPELEKIKGLGKFMQPLANSPILAEINNEFIERKINPHKVLHAKTISLSDTIAGKLGFR